jgi:hypothetical protein
MKKLISLSIITLVAVLFISSCKKDDDATTSSAGTSAYAAGEVSLAFDNIAGTTHLDVTGATNYTNSSGETFSVTKFRYYVSNVSMIKEDGSVYDVPNQVFLIDESDTSSLEAVLQNIPGGKYKGVEYTIGVDSSRTVSGAQQGALDVSNGMYWDWNSGYIFLKLEGTCAAAGGDFFYHIGGYKNSNNTNAQRRIHIDFDPSTLIVDGNKREAEVHILVDVLEFFKNPANYSIVSTGSVMSIGSVAMSLADNYVDMFSLDHIHNDIK